MFVSCLIFTFLVSVASAEPKGKALGHDKHHGNPHVKHAFDFIGGNVKPSGITAGSSAAKANQTGPVLGQGTAGVGKGLTNTNIDTSIKPDGYDVTSFDGNIFLLARPNSDVVVKIESIVTNKPCLNRPRSKDKIHTALPTLTLAAGDAFSNAITGFDSLPCSLTVPDVIGAKGPNPVHGGQHANKGDGNPGGGKGRGHWGHGNRGKGVGNIWTGNQGRGVGEGMAGGCNHKPPEPPAPPQPPESPGSPESPQPPENGKIWTEAAPIPKIRTDYVDENQFEEGGCPALMAWLAEEIGVEAEDIQLYIANTFALSTDIQPCELCARLKDAATILADADGTGIAALAQVINEFATTSAPPSEEQMALIAALAQVINEFATTSAPPSEEQMALIAAAFADHPAAGQWIDALAEYVGIMTELGYSAGDAVTFAGKYVAPVMETGDVSLTAYVEARLAALGG